MELAGAVRGFLRPHCGYYSLVPGLGFSSSIGGAVSALPRHIVVVPSLPLHTSKLLRETFCSLYTRRRPGGLDPRIQLRHAGGCNSRSCQTRVTLKLNYLKDNDARDLPVSGITF